MSYTIITETEKKQKRKNIINALLFIANTCLFTVFITLKLSNNINWSWWWVFAPFWIPIGIAFILIIYLVIIKQKTK